MATTTSETSEQVLLQLNKQLLDRAASIYDFFTVKNTQVDNFLNQLEQFEKRNADAKSHKHLSIEEDLAFINMYGTMRSQFEKNKKDLELLHDKMKLDPNYTNENKPKVIILLENRCQQLEKICKDTDDKICDIMVKKLEYSSKKLMKLMVDVDYEKKLIANPKLDVLIKIEKEHIEAADNQLEKNKEVLVYQVRLDAYKELFETHRFLLIQKKIDNIKNKIATVKNSSEEVAALNDEVKALENERDQYKPDYEKLVKEKEETERNLIDATKKNEIQKAYVKKLLTKMEQLENENQQYISQEDRAQLIEQKQKEAEARYFVKVTKLLASENGEEQFKILCNLSLNNSYFFGDLVKNSKVFVKECFKPNDNNSPLPDYITPSSFNLFLQNSDDDVSIIARIKERPKAFADLLSNVKTSDL